MKIINPANEEVIAELKEDTQSSVARKFNILKKGWRDWSGVPLQERIACIASFDKLLDSSKD